MSAPPFYSYATKMGNLKPVLWQGRAVYKEFEKIRNFIIRQMGDDYADIFAEPDISDPYLVTDSGNWQTVLTDSHPATLYDLEQRGAYSADESKLSKLVQKCNSLLKSSNIEERNWGELLRCCLVVPDKKHIFLQNEKCVLVAWGFEWNERNKTSLSLSKDVQFAHAKNTTAPSSVSPAFAESEEKLKGASETSQPSANISPQEVESGLTSESSGLTQQNQTGSSDQNNQSSGNGSSGNNNDTNRKASFWRKWWWLLLLILSVLLLIYYLSKCKDEVRYVSAKPPIPSKPGVIVPIDSNKIVKDTSSYSYIVSDRLNISLVGDNKDIELFSKKFKQIYPGNEYSIIYYDTIVSRVQIQIPESRREALKTELKKNMPEFKMLVWNEKMFESSGTPSDNGFSDDDKRWYIEKVKAPRAWDLTMGDPSIVVAIIDDGFDLTHEEFQGKIVSPWNVPAGNSDVNTGIKSFHGTHVAGTAIANANNGNGLSGIAPNCKFMPIQVGDANGLMSSTAVIDGVIYAINHGAHVINMSLGPEFPPEIKMLPYEEQLNFAMTQFKEEEEFWNELFAYAAEKNVIVVLAAGNSDIVVGMAPMNRSPHVINVSAVNEKNRKADFSNYGPYSTISAPGVHIYNSFPGNNYQYLDGTSMAAPIVTGSVALIKSVNPAMSFSQIVDLIQTTGIPVNKNDIVGNIIQLDKALGLAQKNRADLPVVDCPEIQRKIDQMLQEIQKLRESCKESGTPKPASFSKPKSIPKNKSN